MAWRRFKPYFSLLKNVKRQFLAAIFFGVLYGISSGFGLPFLTNQVFPIIFESAGGFFLQEEYKEVLSSEQQAKLTREMENLLDDSQKTELNWSEHKGQPSEDARFWYLLGAVSLLPGVFLIRGLSGYLNIYLTNKCGIYILETIRVQLYRKLQYMELSYIQKRESGDLMSRITVDTNQVQMVIVKVANDLVKQPVTFLGAVGALIYLSIMQEEVFFVLVCLAIIPICVLPIRMIGKKMLKRATDLQRQTGDLTASLADSLQAPREIRAFQLEEDFIQRFKTKVNSLLRYQLKVVKYSHLLNPLIEIISAIGVAIAIFYAARTGIKLEAILPLIIALYMSYEPIKKLGKIHNELSRGEASLNRIEEVLHAPEGLSDPVTSAAPSHVKGDIHFNQVMFRYEDQPVLKNISLHIPAGNTVALVGPSGAGKSTIAHLIPRFYEVSSGNITIDSVDLRHWSKKDLRSHISIVTQDALLFSDTIANNIRVGKKDASFEEIREAAQNANAHAFIHTLANGYDTRVGEKGTRLSGGQRQRIAIARAFLHDSPILILDEATSALDTESEAQIHQALEKLVQGKTVLIIAHRFSTLRLASKIALLQDGELLAMAPHKTLYETQPLYRQLFDQQQ